MTDTLTDLIIVPDKEQGIRSLNPKLIIDRHYQDYFRYFNKEKLLTVIQKIKNSGVKFKKDKDMITKIIDEARNIQSRFTVLYLVSELL